MKRLSLGAAICLLIGLALILLLRSKQQTPFSFPPPTVNKTAAPLPLLATTNPLVLNSAPAPIPVEQQQQNASGPAPDSANATNEAAPVNLPPEVIMQNIRRAVHQYGEMFGGNPVGTNPEITAALDGQNPKQINFLRGQPGVNINQNGEMIDDWGTPYFFHQLSATEMEIHSAGPDKIMWTSDDLVTR